MVGRGRLIRTVKAGDYFAIHRGGVELVRFSVDWHWVSEVRFLVPSFTDHRTGIRTMIAGTPEDPTEILDCVAVCRAPPKASTGQRATRTLLFLCEKDTMVMHHIIAHERAA